MRRHIGSVVVAATLVAAGVGGTVASAAAAAPVLVSVHLAGDTAAMARLARTPHLGHRDRLDRLHAAVADLAVRRDVSSYLTSRGFTVTRSSPFVVQAEATRAAVDSTFPETIGGARLPGPLAGEASYVVTSDEEVGALKPLDVAAPLGGDTMRTLYGAPSGQPPAGHQSPTIATVQFSGWDSGDLTTFATATGLPDPVAGGQYQAVSVDGADPTLPDGQGGEIEVALDQESLLATAPYADQVAYFAPNGGSGIIDAIEQVATDAYNGANIGALSISYGMCESDLPLAYIAALHQAVDDALASGVTVFAASGDQGAYTCGPGITSVTSPASDPSVVAVGGSTVTATDPTPAESVWWDGTNGSGGGLSTAFDEPAYQQAVAPGLSGRGVPDITLDGDPASGMTIDVDGLTGQIGGTSLASPLAAATFTDLLSSAGTDYGVGDIHRNLYGAPAGSFRDITSGSNGVYQAGPGYDLASGLGAPQWSAMTDALMGLPTLHAPAISRSRTIPVSVTSPAGMVYDDWTIGTGQEPADCGRPTGTKAPTSVTAPADGVTSIYVIGYTSTYCYVAAAKTRVDSVAPVATAKATRTGTRTATFTWRATDQAPSTGLATYSVKVSRVGASAPLFRRTSTSQRSFTLRNARHGAVYAVQVTAVDVAGNRSKVASGKVAIP